jgi:predicted metal-binding membrane protein
MDAVGTLERVIRRDRALLAVGLAAMTVLAWAYLARSAAGMSAMAAETQMHAAMGMADMRTWGVSDWFGLFVMWAVMMVAMMVPSAAPVMLLVLGVYRRRNDPRARTAAIAFVTGYLVVWGVFSFAASGAQVGLHRVALLTADMRFGSNALAGGVLIAAGAYQFLPWKTACLTHCQSPLGFLQRYWREGAGGGLALGIRHGLFCVGCCWLVMALLFVVGVMDLVWVAVLAGFVLIEKLLRRGVLVGRVAGVAAALWGIRLLLPT